MSAADYLGIGCRFGGFNLYEQMFMAAVEAAESEKRSPDINRMTLFHVTPGGLGHETIARSLRRARQTLLAKRVIYEEDGFLHLERDHARWINPKLLDEDRLPAPLIPDSVVRFARMAGATSGGPGPDDDNPRRGQNAPDRPRSTRAGGPVAAPDGGQNDGPEARMAGDDAGDAARETRRVRRDLSAPHIEDRACAPAYARRTRTRTLSSLQEEKKEFCTEQIRDGGCGGKGVARPEYEAQAYQLAEDWGWAKSDPDCPEWCGTEASRVEHPETWLAAIAYAGRDVKAYGTEVKSPKGYIRAKYAKFLAEGIPAGKFPEPEAVKPVQARRHAPDHGKREAEGPPPELPPVDLPLPREYWEYVCDRSIPGNFVTKGRRWMEEHPEYKPGTPEYEAKVREVRAMRASA